MNATKSLFLDSSAPVEKYKKFPCGCEMRIQRMRDSKEYAFVFTPHDVGCRFYQFALDESRRQGHPTILI